MGLVGKAAILIHGFRLDPSLLKYRDRGWIGDCVEQNFGCLDEAWLVLIEDMAGSQNVLTGVEIQHFRAIYDSFRDGKLLCRQYLADVGETLKILYGDLVQERFSTLSFEERKLHTAGTILGLAEEEYLSDLSAVEMLKLLGLDIDQFLSGFAKSDLHADGLFELWGLDDKDNLEICKMWIGRLYGRYTSEEFGDLVVEVLRKSFGYQSAVQAILRLKFGSHHGWGKISRCMHAEFVKSQPAVDWAEVHRIMRLQQFGAGCTDSRVE